MKRMTALMLMFALLLAMTVTASAAVEVTTEKGAGNIEMSVIGHYDSGSGEGGTEIVAYANEAKKMFVVNGEEKALDIIDLSNLGGGMVMLTSDSRIALEDLEGVTSAKDITSVAVAPDESFVVVCVPADQKQDNGSVVLMDLEGAHIATYTTGALPDMVKVTSDSKMILVANEGEPSDDYTIDPEGSVTMIDVAAGLDAGIVTQVMFKDESIIESTVRKSNNDATYAQNLEPEYIDVNSDNTIAYVVCQESNAVAVLDIASKEFTKVYDLGTKDYSVVGNEIDASNKDDKIMMANYPVLSMYQPDGIDVVTIDGQTYLFTANEGDAQDYDGYSEETRVGDVADMVMLDASNYAGYTQEQLDQLVVEGLFEDQQLGRLKITTATGTDADGKYTALYGYGARSFSIFDVSTMDLVFDSGSDFEETAAKVSPEYFNTTNDELAFDDRSDDKGPEPENVVVGMVGDSNYAFIGLERFGGLMAYNVDDVTAPSFELYTTTRVFDETMGGDLAPEGLAFVEASNSPTDNALLFVANEVSGTVVIFEIAEAEITEADMVESEKVEAESSLANQVAPGTVLEHYTINDGDVFWKIAKTHGLNLEQLMSINPDIEDMNLIYAGETMNVPK